MNKNYRIALILAYLTIIYNIAEGIISIYFGLHDNTIALFGFGLDSFVEVLSGFGVWYMIKRIMKNGNEDNKSDFEITALKITGVAFYLLSAGLLITAGINIYYGNKPETTFWGVVISSVSLLIMWIMIIYKIKVGKELNSKAIIADANCSKACMYLSVSLLISSFLYETTGVDWIDSLGAIAIAIFSFREARESFEKTASKNCCCGDEHCK